jgi:hypothetical protein
MAPGLVAPFTSTAPAVDSTYANGNYVARTAYNLVNGQMALSNSPKGVNDSYVYATDHYRVVGLPAGTPVTLLARFAVDGFARSDGCGGSGCVGIFYGRIHYGSQVVERSVQQHFTGEADLHETLELSIPVLAGDDIPLQFDLEILTYPGSNDYGSGTGQIQFGPLPAGAGIVSCQGYSLAPTPARQSTWGALKSRYH